MNKIDKYIKLTTPQFFLADLLVNPKLSHIIINNNLYWKNLDLLLENFGYDITLNMFKLLYLNDTEKKLFNNDMAILFKDEKNKVKLFFDINKIININKCEKKYNFSNIFNKSIKQIDFNISYEVIYFLYHSKYKNVVNDNFNYLLEKTDHILELKKLVKDDENLLSEINNYINNNPDKLICEILTKGFLLDLETLHKERVFDLLKELISELLLNQKLNYSDVEYLGLGSYTYVVNIGTKVLKVGKKRKTFVLENNKRFLKPILRTEIMSINSNEILGCIEITEKVDTSNIKRKDIYVLFKELRDKGYIWVDCKKSNVGKLVRKNKIYFDDLTFENEVINYTTDNQEELEQGELVILDNDYIFTEDEFDKLPEKIKESYLIWISSYETKYQKEGKKLLKK